MIKRIVPFTRNNEIRASNCVRGVIQLKDALNADGLIVMAVPAGSIVKNVYLNVVEAFNAGGDDKLDVGVMADASVGLTGDDDSIFDAVDVSSVGLTVSTTFKDKLVAQAPLYIFAKYVPAGTAPTTGTVEITVDFLDTLRTDGGYVVDK